MTPLTRDEFGDDFTWGAATASYQIEGAWDLDGKGPSIWDTFTHRRSVLGRSPVVGGATGDEACDFYHRSQGDIALLAEMGFAAKRFSISWPRVLPDGTGRVNPAGLDFYSRVVDECLAAGVEPWITLYHWDLPQALQDRGGWAARDVVGWFEEYVTTVTTALGDRVKHWLVFNEPLSFLVMGNLLGAHAPGIRSRNKFLAGLHHVNLAQAAGARAVRANVADAVVGTTHYLADIAPTGTTAAHARAVRTADAFINRTYLEPNLGLGYPLEECGFLRGVEKHIRPGDDTEILVDWDVLGVQYYTRFKAKLAPVPGMWTVPVFGKDHHNFDITATGWEVNPEGLHQVLMRSHAYGRFPRLVVTENGAAYPDRLVRTDDTATVHDPRRTLFYQLHLDQVRRAIADGAPVEGYFAWSLTDNFEWADGYGPRFGLVHVDYDTQERTIKDSGRWFQQLLTGSDRVPGSWSSAS